MYSAAVRIWTRVYAGSSGMTTCRPRPPDVFTHERTRKLAKLRVEEGYMAESRPAPDGSLLLIENHCPVCAAARACQGLCRSELEIFRALLPGASVERVDHILAGARRCAYRIEAAPGLDRTRSRF